MAAALGHYTCAVRSGEAFQEDVLQAGICSDELAAIFQMLPRGTWLLSCRAAAAARVWDKPHSQKVQAGTSSV